MTLLRKRHSKPQSKPLLPPVTTATRGPDLGIGGRRLGTLGMCWLKVECECGHEGQIAVADLADRYGAETRVRHAAETLRCSQCGHARIRKITLAD